MARTKDMVEKLIKRYITSTKPTKEAIEKMQKMQQEAKSYAEKKRSEKA